MKSRLLIGLSVCALALAAQAQACTRILYQSGTKDFVVGRTMDWTVDPHTDLWTFPKGFERDGGVGARSIKWTSKYRSVVSSFYDVATVDGINEAGLVANTLYLVETDYGDAKSTEKPLISVGAWTQYALDNFATVAEAVDALSKEPFVIVAPELPDGHKAAGHLSLADATGDSAIFEYVGGKLVIHHSPSYTVMTNSPSFDKQLTLNAYWQGVGGSKFLPGTISSPDRFVRASYFLGAAQRVDDPVRAAATVFSLARAVSVPLGISDPDQPNIASTIWRTVSDAGARRYYFESSYSPTIFWVELDKLHAKPMKLDLSGHPTIAGEASDRFVPAAPFKFLAH